MQTRLKRLTELSLVGSMGLALMGVDCFIEGHN